MRQKRKSQAGLLIALTCPWPLYLLGLRDLYLWVFCAVTVLAARLVMDIVWPDETDHRS